MAKLRYEYETLASGKVIARTFAPTGELVMESHTHGQLAIGINFSFDHGRKVSESYFCKGRSVGRKAYEKAREQYPDMPRPEAGVVDGNAELRRLAAAERRRNKERAKTPANPEAGRSLDEFCLRLLREARAASAPDWVSDEHTLGEMSAPQSRKLVAKLQRLGAVAIHACQIDVSADGTENTGHLVVELPAEPAQRKALLDELGRLAQAEGYDGDADNGQRYAYLKLD